MRRFENILVGIDALAVAGFEGSGLPVEASSALGHARWVAEHARGRLTVAAVLPEDASDDLVDFAEGLLRERALPLLGGGAAETVVLRGEAFVEITRRVIRESHDLVIVAARRHSLVHRAIVGSTALKLLRKCPCLVWVAPRRFVHGPKTVLSAAGFHGLTPAILDLSSSLVQLTDGDWHVVHCVEYPEEGGMRLRNAPDAEVEAYEESAREQAWKRLHELVDPIARATGLHPRLWLAEGRPDEQIALASREVGADVLVMGTIGRAGVAGMIIGNTAEKLLQIVECSVLALKPEGFTTPVALDD